MARPAGWIDDGQLQKLFGRIGRLGFSLVQHWVESAIEQKLHQAVWRVIRACRFALVAPLLYNFRGEKQSLAVVAQLGLEFEQRFIDRAQLLGLHRTPIHRHHAGSVS